MEPVEAGRSLHVRKVLTGELTRQGGRFAVTADLVDPVAGSTIWSYRTDQQPVAPGLPDANNPEGPLRLREAIVAGILGKLQIWLSPRAKQKALQAPTANGQAYKL